jgi:hypothetical protein
MMRKLANVRQVLEVDDREVPTDAIMTRRFWSPGRAKSLLLAPGSSLASLATPRDAEVIDLARWSRERAGTNGSETR